MTFSLSVFEVYLCFLCQYHSFINLSNFSLMSHALVLSKYQMKTKTLRAGGGVQSPSLASCPLPGALDG